MRERDPSLRAARSLIVGYSRRTPMTKRLYFTDSYLTEFESEVASCRPADGRFEVCLSETAFYPTGGGQPHDKGALGGRSVLDVVDRDDAGIVHVVDGPLEPGERVRGIVDWKRRFDHMQQHSGQHILSAAFESVCRAGTDSFHLGATASTIDLNRSVSPAEIAAAEDAANAVVWQDREIRLRFAPGEEAANLTLRKESSREGALRLIEVPDFDLSACGGTHVARTGVIGIIAVTDSEKFRNGTRVEFLCGGRALDRMREWRRVFSDARRILSVLPGGLAPAIERLQGDNKAMGRALRDLQGQLAAHKAAELVSAGTRRPDGRLVAAQAFEGWQASGLSAIASAAAASPGVCVAVFSAAAPVTVAVARASDLSLSAAGVVRELLGRFGGKGGGRPELAQGGGLEGEVAKMVECARELLEA